MALQSRAIGAGKYDFAELVSKAPESKRAELKGSFDVAHGRLFSILPLLDLYCQSQLFFLSLYRLDG